MNTAERSEFKLQVTGMTCASCASCALRVEQALLKVPGVSGATVNLALLREWGLEEGGLHAQAQRLERQGRTVSWLLRADAGQRRLRGLLAFGDMAGGADVATETAGITPMRGDPRLVADSLDVSRRTCSKIQQGLLWAFGYNVLGIPLAALGLLNPVMAGAAMAFSSVSVVLNA